LHGMLFHAMIIRRYIKMIPKTTMATL